MAELLLGREGQVLMAEREETALTVEMAALEALVETVGPRSVEGSTILPIQLPRLEPHFRQIQ